MRPWRDHLEPDDAMVAGGGPVPHGLLDGGTLPALWGDRWDRHPQDRLWFEGGRWWTAGEFAEATVRAAGRLRAAGLRPGDRMVWSTDTSVAALVAHVGALRAGLVVVPANTAYSERELSHIVTDLSLIHI